MIQTKIIENVGYDAEIKINNFLTTLPKGTKVSQVKLEQISYSPSTQAVIVYEVPDLEKGNKDSE